MFTFLKAFWLNKKEIFLKKKTLPTNKKPLLYSLSSYKLKKKNQLYHLHLVLYNSDTNTPIPALSK